MTNKLKFIAQGVNSRGIGYGLTHNGKGWYTVYVQQTTYNAKLDKHVSKWRFCVQGLSESLGHEVLQEKLNKGQRV